MKQNLDSSSPQQTSATALSVPASVAGHTITHARARLAESDRGITDAGYLRACAAFLLGTLDASDDDLNAADALFHRAEELAGRP